MDRETFYKLFEESPGDLSAYGAMADLLDGDGWNVLAHAFRWMWKRGLYPHKRTHYATALASPSPTRKVPKSFRWAWYRRPIWSGDDTVPGVWPVASRAKHGLPMLVLRGDQKVFKSHQEAVMWLGAALQLLRNDYDIDPPKLVGKTLIDVLQDDRDGTIIETPELLNLEEVA